ncbi:COP9 signalosome complex subunit 6 [Elsinoe australis]|uniref:COP9 signalosome complex subunit 6 n=1 Tax=Elsinoe australis TaxID=40998 RepID=A0A4U7B3V6_9PEZI|nr:COP9 signalosome complex subunit 6 [Elsinoe australis]
MASNTPNPLVSAKPSDSPLVVKLHPLVLITITDYISRHTLTQKQGPIVGAVLGQQNGREVTMEHAFESVVKPKPGVDGKESIVMDEPWFSSRVAQYKEVHAQPPLDLTAIFTLGSTKGPAPDHVPVVQQIKATYNDDVLLVLFHPETILDGSLTGGKLPITVYEAFYEPGTEDGDKGLQVDGWGVGRQLQLKFRQIPFEVETGEAEMIGVDYVAKGAANANLAVDPSRKASTAALSSKGKEKVLEQTNGAVDTVLSPEDEELIASLTSKSNAIKMLHSRINLIKTYLQSLPPSYLTDPSLAPSQDLQIPHTLLRQISALLSRLPLLAPPSMTPSSTNGTNGASTAAQSHNSIESSDVALTTLLSTLTKTIADTRELTQKATIVTRARNDRKMASMARDGSDVGMGKFSRKHGGGGGGGGGSGFGSGAGSFGPEEGGFDSGLDGGEEY